MKNLVFLYVGLENWGLSQTLTIITNNDRRKKIIDVNGESVFIKKMFDCTKMLEYAKGIHESKFDFHLLSYHPLQMTSYNHRDILKTLKKSSTIIFYVQTKSQNTDEEISDDDINSLKEFGTVMRCSTNESALSHSEILMDLVRKECLRHQNLKQKRKLINQDWISPNKEINKDSIVRVNSN